MVVVILTTVVDVWTTVEPAGHSEAAVQISVIMYVEVTRKMEVVVSPRARSTTARKSVKGTQ